MSHLFLVLVDSTSFDGKRYVVCVGRTHFSSRPEPVEYITVPPEASSHPVTEAVH